MYIIAIRGAPGERFVAFLEKEEKNQKIRISDRTIF